MLNPLARDFAREISAHDFSDAPWRLDRAGHQRHHDHPSRQHDTPLTQKEADRVRLNVVWVVAQVLLQADPDLDLHEFAQACGVPRTFTHNNDGRRSGAITNGIRWETFGKVVLPPGRNVPTAADVKLMATAVALRDMQTPHAWGGGGIEGSSFGLHDGGAADAHEDHSKRGFDAGSLVQYLLHRAYGIKAPRVTENQYTLGHEVTAGEVLPGDLVFPAAAGRPPHNAHVYLGDNLIANIGGSGDMLRLTPLTDTLEEGEVPTAENLHGIEIRRVLG